MDLTNVDFQTRFGILLNHQVNLLYLKHTENEYPIQQDHQCGSYSVWFVLWKLKNEESSPKDISHVMSNKLFGPGTMPWKIVSFLKSKGIHIKTKKLSSASNQERIDFLKEEVEQQGYIILLGRANENQHYLVVFENDSGKDFTLYDPLVGRRVISQSDLLTFWSGGGVFGFYNWFAVVAS